MEMCQFQKGKDMIDKLQLIKQAAHDSMWYRVPERQEAYNILCELIENYQEQKAEVKPKKRKTKGA